MKRVILFALMSAASVCGQMLDFSSLDKLSAKAEESNVITLGPEQLKAAMQMAASNGRGKDLDHVKGLVSNLKGVVVRNFEFSKSNQYSDADLEPIRAQLAKKPGWTKIVDSKEKNEHSEIYMLSQNGQSMGLAVIAAEEEELSVVYIDGPLSLSDLGSLQGAMGLVNMQAANQARPKKSKPANR